MSLGEAIDTARLRLERWDPAHHTDALVALNADREVMRYIGEGVPATRAESERQSEAIAAHWDRFGFGLSAVRSAGPADSDPRVPSSRDVLGFAGLAHPLWFPSERALVEVGWRLRRDAWGQGFASEAARAGLELGFRALGLERIVSYIRPDNTRSQGVSRRLGMEVARVVPHPRLPHSVEVWELRAGRPCPAGG